MVLRISAKKTAPFFALPFRGGIQHAGHGNGSKPYTIRHIRKALSGAFAALRLYAFFMQGAFLRPGRLLRISALSRANECEQRIDVGKIVIIALKTYAMVANAGALVLLQPVKQRLFAVPACVELEAVGLDLLKQSLAAVLLAFPAAVQSLFKGAGSVFAFLRKRAVSRVAAAAMLVAAA